MRNRKIWVRDWKRSRPAQGAYHQLVRELKMGDECSYRNFLRMDPATFELLLSEVGYLQGHKNAQSHNTGRAASINSLIFGYRYMTQFILYYSSLNSILFTHYFCVFLQVKVSAVFSTCIEYHHKLSERSSLNYVQQ